MFNIYSSNPVMLAKRFHSVAFLYALIFSDATLSTFIKCSRIYNFYTGWNVNRN